MCASYESQLLQECANYLYIYTRFLPCFVKDDETVPLWWLTAHYDQLFTIHVFPRPLIPKEMLIVHMTYLDRNEMIEVLR